MNPYAAELLARALAYLEVLPEQLDDEEDAEDLAELIMEIDLALKAGAA